MTYRLTSTAAFEKAVAERREIHARRDCVQEEPVFEMSVKRAYGSDDAWHMSAQTRVEAVAEARRSYLAIPEDERGDVRRVLVSEYLTGARLDVLFGGGWHGDRYR